MASGDLIFHCTGATVGSSVAGVVAARVSHSSVVGISPTVPTGAGARGEQQMQKQDIKVELIGKSIAALVALVGAAAANCVVDFKGSAGASQTCTAKSVMFSELGQVEFRDPDTGGKVVMHSVAGYCNWGDADTLATMLVFA